ncbi:MAG: hypothetical protein FJZ58_02315 [Chlamydiae bacterium]|nr:hypothetical protein [Chlamydiota bacterium]
MQISKRALWVVFACLICPLWGKEAKLHVVPDMDVTEEFLRRIDTEDSSIFLACERLTDDKLVRILIEARRRGTLVEVVVDPVSVTKKRLLEKLAKEGVLVFVWQPEHNNNTKEHMHHAFCVFGKEEVWIGPATLGRPTSPHRDSVLVCSDSALSARFLEEFDRVKYFYSKALSVYLSDKK